MAMTALPLHFSLIDELAHWLVSRNSKHSTASKIQYHLCGRAALISLSLLSLTEAVSRAVMSGMAYIGYLISLGCWKQTKHFSSDQMQKGAYAKDIILICLRSIISPKKLVNHLPKLLTPEIREQRIRKGTGLIACKLYKELRFAKSQAAQEPDKAFQYFAASAEFEGKVLSGRIASYEVGICHFIGRRKKMEDQHLVTSFKLPIGNRSYPVQLFGIFDGHSGGAAARYMKKNLKYKLRKTLNEFCASELTNEAIWNALKISFIRLNQEFKNSKSGTTATVVMILDEKLWTANLGDSRTILDNGIQLSEDAKPANPRYQKGIEHRGGKVFSKRANGTQRVNGRLAIARSIGDHNIGAISARPKITVYPLSEILNGNHLILACDGIYDVSSTRQVAAAVQAHKDLPSAELAKNIVHSAFVAGSGDNLSALVVKLIF